MANFHQYYSPLFIARLDGLIHFTTSMCFLIWTKDPQILEWLMTHPSLFNKHNNILSPKKRPGLNQDLFRLLFAEFGTFTQMLA